MATIKFRDNYCIVIRDNDNREVILHIDDVIQIVREIFGLAYDVCRLKDKLEDILERR